MPDQSPRVHISVAGLECTVGLVAGLARLRKRLRAGFVAQSEAADEIDRLLREFERGSGTDAHADTDPERD
jgi:hypothetical protein